MDIAASIQAVTEEIVLRIARYAHELTGKRNLCLAGGVALNCVANGKICARGRSRQVWIQPAAGDAGGALGAALCSPGTSCSTTRSAQAHDATQHGSLLGPSYTTRDPRVPRLESTPSTLTRTRTSELSSASPS
jgi:carbamoyltransferase